MQEKYACSHNDNAPTITGQGVVVVDRSIGYHSRLLLAQKRLFVGRPALLLPADRPTSLTRPLIRRWHAIWASLAWAPVTPLP